MSSTLRALVGQIRNAKGPTEEANLAAASLKRARQRLISACPKTGPSTAVAKAEGLCLMFLAMLGFVVEADLISAAVCALLQENAALKDMRIGCLMFLELRPKDEVSIGKCITRVSTLLARSGDNDTIELALATIANMDRRDHRLTDAVSPRFLEGMLPVLQSASRTPRALRKGLLALRRVVFSAPEAVCAQVAPLVDLIQAHIRLPVAGSTSGHLGVTLSAFALATSLVDACVSQGGSSGAQCVLLVQPTLGVLRGLGDPDNCPREYKYFSLPAPLVQVAALRLIGALAPFLMAAAGAAESGSGAEDRGQDDNNLNAVLMATITSFREFSSDNKNTNVNAFAAAAAVLVEACVATAAFIPPEGAAASNVLTLATKQLAYAALSSDALLVARDISVGHSVSAAVLRPLGILSADLRADDWVATIGRRALDSSDPLVQSRVRAAFRGAFPGDTWAHEVASRTGKTAEFIEGKSGDPAGSTGCIVLSPSVKVSPPSVPRGGSGDGSGRCGCPRDPPSVYVDVARHLDALLNGQEVLTVEESTSVLLKLEGFPATVSPDATFTIKFKPAPEDKDVGERVLFHDAANDTTKWAPERLLSFQPASRDARYFAESFELVRWRTPSVSDTSLLPFTLRYDVREDVPGGALSVLLTLTPTSLPGQDQRFAELPVVVTVPLPGNTLRMTVASCTGGDGRGIFGQLVRSTARLENGGGCSGGHNSDGGVKTTALVWRVHGMRGGTAVTLAAEVVRTPHLLFGAWEPPNARATFALTCEPTATVRFLKVTERVLSNDVKKYVRYILVSGRFEALPNFTRGVAAGDDPVLKKDGGLPGAENGGYLTTWEAARLWGVAPRSVAERTAEEAKGEVWRARRTCNRTCFFKKIFWLANPIVICFLWCGVVLACWVFGALVVAQQAPAYTADEDADAHWPRASACALAAAAPAVVAYAGAGNLGGRRLGGIRASPSAGASAPSASQPGTWDAPRGGRELAAATLYQVEVPVTFAPYEGADEVRAVAYRHPSWGEKAGGFRSRRKAEEYAAKVEADSARGGGQLRCFFDPMRVGRAQPRVALENGGGQSPALFVGVGVLLTPSLVCFCLGIGTCMAKIWRWGHGSCKAKFKADLKANMRVTIKTKTANLNSNSKSSQMRPGSSPASLKAVKTVGEGDVELGVSTQSPLQASL